VIIDADLFRRLVAVQFPQWADLPVTGVAVSGWDNRTFRLGDTMLIRAPSAEAYVAQVEKEQVWLPKLAPHLPLTIPQPIARGEPGEGYPWCWSVYGWIEGEAVTTASIVDPRQLAGDLAGFLRTLQTVDTADGPPAGRQSFYRGGPLSTYDRQTRQAIAALDAAFDVRAITAIWDEALASVWIGPPVWVHGDVAPGNLLLRDDRLCAVIDWGIVAIGDPACDLAIAWSYFEGSARNVFRAHLPIDDLTWSRGRGWALWKALILVTGLAKGAPREVADAGRVIGEVLA